MIKYKGYTIRKSGKRWFRIYTPDGKASSRVPSEDAGKALINSISEKRIMTPKEHALIYSNPPIRRKPPRITPTRPRLRR